MRKVLFFLITASCSSLVAQQLCNITATANHNPICQGSNVIITANGMLQSGGGYNFNFNSGSLPGGWTTSGTTLFTSPCGPSPSGTSYYWAASSGNATPEIRTAALNVTGGGTVDFSFIYSQQGGMTPCEGPDLAREGVSLQYSINNGVSWVDITYFSPAGVQLPTNPGTANGVANGPTPYTVWNIVSIPIPPAAQTASTMFRWIQFFSSGTCCDNWGLEDININGGSTGNYSWSTGLTGSNANTDTLFSVQNDTCVVVTISDSTGFGCSDTVCIQVIDLSNSVSVTPGCSGQMTFADTSGFVFTSYVWNFGNGSTSIQANPTHTYSNFGNYTGSLVITAPMGCQDSVQFPISVLDADPTANFILPTNCGLVNLFTDNSNTPSGPGQIVGWSWNFGDGNTSSAQNPTHTYAQPGQWQVTLTVTAANGCTDSYTMPYTNWAFPIAQFLSPTTCALNSVQFTDQSSVPLSQIANWEWDFGLNGSSISGTSNPTFIYQTEGVYPVTLVVTSANGCTDTLTQNLSILPLPLVDFTINTPCEGFNSQFVNTTSVSQGSIAGYQWFFGFGIPSQTTINPTVLIPTAGTWPITLIASSAAGCIDSTTKNAVVWPKPNIAWNANPLSGCYPVTPFFDNQTSIDLGSVVQWIWTFGDGATSAQESPSHTYPNAAGSYTVSLYAVSDKGCDTSVAVLNYVTVRPQPTAAFDWTPEKPTVNNPLVQFRNKSDMGENFQWDFGNGMSSTDENPRIYYAADTNSYPVQLIVFNQWGCADTVWRLVKVIPEYTLYVPNSFTPDGDGLNEFFTIQGTAIVEADMEIFDRWGASMYYGKNLEPIQKGWDGKTNANLVPQGSYVYRLSVRDAFNLVHEYHGHINLIR